MVINLLCTLSIVRSFLEITQEKRDRKLNEQGERRKA